MDHEGKGGSMEGGRPAPQGVTRFGYASQRRVPPPPPLPAHMANQAAAPIAQAPDEELVVTPPQVQQRLDVPLPAQSVAQQHPTTNVTVCVRVRPLLPSERVNQCQKCVKVRDNSKSVVVGSSRALSFDHVFDEGAHQEQVYATAVRGLVEGCFLGYNATVFAYGQTGSGKSYTMGSVGDLDSYPEECKGIIPRVIRDIFVYVEQQKQRQAEEAEGAGPAVQVSFSLKVGYVEIYNEEVRDLLHLSHTPPVASSSQASAGQGNGLNGTGMGGAAGRGLASRGAITIREDAKGRIIMAGAREESVSSMEEVYALLNRGSAVRTTSNTLMNESSSRSHAIFTIIIDKTLVLASSAAKSSSKKRGKHEAVSVRAKFHLVDLAGSERAKRTGASGTRLKESININQGLLTLGKVISALSVVEGQGGQAELGHVPYRESKLTRLLQDSLGGNSRTVMIACISPADIDLQESLNTVKYSNRARAIQNKPIINFGPKASAVDEEEEEEGEALVAARTQLQALQLELLKVHQQASSASSVALEKKQEEVEGLCNRLGEVTRRVVHLTRDVRRLKKRAAATGEREDEAGPALASGLAAVEEGLETLRRIAATDEGAYAVPLLAQVTELELALCSRNEELDNVKRELQEKEDDLARDEQIFASKMKEIKRCHAQIRDYQAALQQLDRQLREQQQRQEEQEQQHAQPKGRGSQGRPQDKDEEDEEEGDKEEETRRDRHGRRASHDEEEEEEEEEGEEEEEESKEKVAQLLAAKQQAEKEKEKLLMEAEARSKEAEDYRRKTERQIQTLEVNIRLKEELIRSLAHSEKEAEQLVRKYEDRVQSLEEETTTLRENLQHIGRELSDVSHESRSLVEQKRRQEAHYQAALRKAEAELLSLKQQKEEQNRVSKLRQRSDERMAMLEMEVRRMSSERENLIKRLKEEEKKERTKAEALAKHVQALKQQASEHVRRIRELEARNSHLHRSLANQTKATPRSARRPSSGGESLRSARTTNSSRHPSPQASERGSAPPTSRQSARQAEPGQEAKGRRRGNNQEEKEDEGREDMGALVQWFHDRWHGLTEGVKAKRQMGRHVDRKAQACREKAELAAEKRQLVEKRSEASRRVQDEAAQLNSSIERLHGVLEGRVKEYQAREDRAGATKLQESIRTTRLELQDQSQRLRTLEERISKGQMLDEEEERRLEQVDDALDALDEEIRYLDTQVERLAASLPAEQAQALMNQQEGQEGDRQGQAWQQQDTEAFLSQLGEVSGPAAKALLRESCRELLELQHKADKESTEVALLQMRLEQKTTVCADFAKAMHKTKAEFGKRQARLQRESEEKIQYLLRQLREYERASSAPNSARASADNASPPATSRSQDARVTGASSASLQKQLTEEQKRGRELQALNLKLLRELQSAQQALATSLANKGLLGSVVPGTKVRLPSKALREIDPPVKPFHMPVPTEPQHS